MLDNLRYAMPPWGYDLLTALIAVAIGIVVAMLLHQIAYQLLGRLAARSQTQSDNIALVHLRRPTRFALIVVGLVLAARETASLQGIWEKFAGFVIPAMIGWILLAGLNAVSEAIDVHRSAQEADDRTANRRRTRLAIFIRIAAAMVIVVTLGLMLLSIPAVREVGVTLMASAGIAGLAVGAAAQPALKSLIAGLQMALTEPISIDDMVVIDGQSGRIEEIRSTYVIVRTWDQRRLVVPTAKFLETTFENWSREGSEMLGTAFLHLDPAADIAALRAEFTRLIEAHPLWDRRKHSFQVTEISAGSIEVRMVVSAAGPAALFDLRADLREAMLAFICEHQPAALAHERAFDPLPEPGNA